MAPFIFVTLEDAVAEATAKVYAETSYGRLHMPDKDCHVVRQDDSPGSHEVHAEIKGPGSEHIDFHLETTHGAIALNRHS